jgi:hypothetical protein
MFLCSALFILTDSWRDLQHAPRVAIDLKQNLGAIASD